MSRVREMEGDKRGGQAMWQVKVVVMAMVMVLLFCICLWSNEEERGGTRKRASKTFFTNSVKQGKENQIGDGPTDWMKAITYAHPHSKNHSRHN